MLKIQRDINEQDFEIQSASLSNKDDFHSPEVVNRVSETQLQVGENAK